MSETMAQRMEKRDCNNHIYLKNLVESLEQAKVRKDIERIILYASELERYKIVCGNSPVIQQFEASIRRVSEELGLTNYPAIERAMSTHPQRLCQCDTCEEEEHPNIERGRTMGFRAMLDGAAYGTIERSVEDVESDTPVRRDGFLGMLEDMCRETPQRRIIMRMTHR